MLRTFLLCVLFATVLLIGFLIGKMVSVPNLSFETNINPLHGVSILVTLFIALLLSIFFDTNKSKVIGQKEIMIKRMDKILEMIDGLQNHVLAGKVDVQFGIAFTKRFNGATSYIWASLATQGVRVKLAQGDIESVARQLKDLLTNTPAYNDDAQGAPPIRVVDKSFEYSPARIAELIANLEDLKNKLFQTQLEINAS